ncbi:hypothetical protein HK405_012207, partial [Cladochytrium tenue]
SPVGCDSVATTAAVAPAASLVGATATPPTATAIADAATVLSTPSSTTTPYTGQEASVESPQAEAGGLKSGVLFNGDDPTPGGTPRSELQEDSATAATFASFSSVEPNAKDLAQSVADDGGYAVISHVWGDLNEKHIINYPGVPWKIKIKSAEKMDRILSVARQLKIKWLWMDVLCMDQGDSEDIAREIPRMGSIFSQASRCVAVMTLPDMVAREFAFRDRGCAKRASVIAMVGKEGATSSDDAREVCRAVCDLFHDDWFWRVWTYQEAVLPSNKVTAVTERGDVLETSVDDWLDTARILQDRYAQSYPGFIVGGRKSPAGDSFPPKRSFAGIHHLAIVRRRRLDDTLGFFPLGKVIAGIGRRDCQYEDDRLFGILGILSYGKWFQKVPDEPFWRSWLRLAELGLAAGDLSLLGFKRCHDTGPTDQDARPDPVRGSFSGAPCHWFGVFSNGGAPVDYERLMPMQLIRPGPPSVAFESARRLLRRLLFDSSTSTSQASLPLHNQGGSHSNPQNAEVLVGSPPVIDADGWLHMDCVYLGQLRWVGGAALTEEDPEDLLELMSQIMWQGKITNSKAADWLCQLLGSGGANLTKRRAASTIAAMVMRRDYTVGGSPAHHDAADAAFREDGRRGHGMWDVRNEVDAVLQRYANRAHAAHCGRPAVLRAADSADDHILVLDQQAPVGADVFAYAFVDRGAENLGLMTLVCGPAGPGAPRRVIARSTPIHTMPVSTLRGITRLVFD